MIVSPREPTSGHVTLRGTQHVSQDMALAWLELLEIGLIRHSLLGYVAVICIPPQTKKMCFVITSFVRTRIEESWPASITHPDCQHNEPTTPAMV